MIKIATVDEMRAIEVAADKAGVSYAQMMDNAGRAVANRVKPILEEFRVGIQFSVAAASSKSPATM